MNPYVDHSHAVPSSSLMTRVFSWMFAGLSLTAIISALLLTDGRMIDYFYYHRPVFYGLMIFELVLVFFLAARVYKMSVGTATLVFFLYATLNGVTLTPLLALYTGSSILGVFVTAAGMFGAFALYGAITKKDLSKLGSIFLMALIGLIIATVVNMFLNNGMLSMILCYIGVIIFCGLTAYDIQNIKRQAQMAMDEDTHTKVAILGALNLYLDFINIFIYLLRLFGSRD
ncbi:Bax inhibitor-1/YccA family protein [Marininema halotolerans]|uniref:Modulator of FtsH protease n=1 Tax=Marininema halotolerans TaxID=1155944 RepID=A0A1I6TL52_9BACL|nr:Bax inhibitor-1/YccA family protein [Marininema halotolerans]SFS89906.1 hypothetical protein SAMN05444972_11096 [Marininema halotolerans]